MFNTKTLILIILQTQALVCLYEIVVCKDKKVNRAAVPETPAHK